MKKITLLSVLVIFFASCGRNALNDIPEENTLPPITQTGANTFGCKLNGVVFLPNAAIGSTVVEKPMHFYGYYIGTPNHSNKLSTKRGKDVKNLFTVELYMYKFSIIGNGEYTLNDAYFYNDNNQPFNSYMKCYAKSPSTGEWKNYGSFINSGKIVVTRFDNNGCSGIFDGKLKEENGNEIIEITNGRFDINYSTL